MIIPVFLTNLFDAMTTVSVALPRQPRFARQIDFIFWYMQAGNTLTTFLTPRTANPNPNDAGSFILSQFTLPGVQKDGEMPMSHYPCLHLPQGLLQLNLSMQASLLPDHSDTTVTVDMD